MSAVGLTGIQVRQGHPDFLDLPWKLPLDQWVGAFVPVGTPAAIIERLNTEIGKALADPSVRQTALDAGAFAFLAKPFEDEVLVQLIRDAAAV